LRQHLEIARVKAPLCEAGVVSTCESVIPRAGEKVVEVVTRWRVVQEAERLTLDLDTSVTPRAVRCQTGCSGAVRRTPIRPAVTPGDGRFHTVRRQIGRQMALRGTGRLAGASASAVFRRLVVFITGAPFDLLLFGYFNGTSIALEQAAIDLRDILQRFPVEREYDTGGR
jgi:hypothetical protein